MHEFQFLAFFLAMLLVGGAVADNLLAPVIDLIAKERD